MATESTLVTAIKRAILKNYPDAWVLKVVGSPQQESGVPDLLVCVQGRLVGLEVKRQRPGESAAYARGRATPIQLAQLARIRAAGGIAGVVLSAEEAMALIMQAEYYVSLNSAG